MAARVLAIFIFVFVCACLLDSCEGWRGHYHTVLRVRFEKARYCTCWYWWWRCSHHGWRWRKVYYYRQQCRPGWTHNGNQDCSIPVCRPRCVNGGTCTSPNNCNCPSTATGSWCQNPTCSYRLPCYPGNCYGSSRCECEPGFKSGTTQEGCLSFDESVESMYPVISQSSAKLMHIRRTDNRKSFEFNLDATNKPDTEEIWLNQKRFNVLEFQFESLFPEFENLPDRPNYVFDSAFGIVHSQIQVNVTKVSRSGSPIRNPGSFETHNCTGLGDESPAIVSANCTIYNDQFNTLIEHADWMGITYQTRNGGFRDLRNIDDRNKPYRLDHYKGLIDVKKVKFKFDFIAPKYCEEYGAYESCPPNPSMLHVEDEFTRGPIRPRWIGWTDDLSGVFQYYIEIFLLLPGSDGKLVERHPLGPLFNAEIRHENITFPEYTPERPGVYSVLMEVRDKANNSRITRRFAIHDDQSEITFNTEDAGKLFVLSADEQNGFKWQTTRDIDGKSTFVVTWANHFMNTIHESGKFLNEIEQYPIQFKDIEDDGVLFSQKYVASALDDYEGSLTRDGVTNFHGIVSFEVNKVFTNDLEEPTTGWKKILPLAEKDSFRNAISDGDGVRIWVRAKDAMGSVKVDSTYVQVDTSGPSLSKVDNPNTNLQVNFDGEGGKYNYTSRITFKASDPHSGVHEIAYTIRVETLGKEEDMVFSGREPANFYPEDGFCTGLDGICYLPEQTLDLDNCWFMINKDDLTRSSATVTVTVFNRAMMNDTVEFVVPRINELHGLEKYTGPENFRIEPTNTTATSFIVAWDLPEQISCYGLADIVLVVFYKEDGKNKTETIVVDSTETFLRLGGRSPKTEYQISPEIKNARGDIVAEGLRLSVQTHEPLSQDTGVSAGVVAGVAVGVIALVAVVLVVFVILIRRGHFQPVQRGISTARTKVVQKTREKLYGEAAGSRRRRQNAYVYDNRSSELYTYGGMDFEEIQSWHIARSDVTLETLLKNGHFANIYTAVLNKKKRTRETVVAKTLKDNFTEGDETLMKAKINFTATVVGSHPNVVKFIGAVVDDPAMGPFLIYEYCEHGPLKDYLQTLKSNVTVEVQDNLYRFGLDIAKGMEYLASKGIVHRRLAARNVLLTFLIEIKIAGFGPQPAGGSDEDADAEAGKKERIPIKWMAPECMSSTVDATEKNDVWSYAVVLWEIFTIGSTPYENVRSRDLPPRIKKGERLPQPEYCDDTWYRVMKKCWALQPEKRPTFSDIRNQLDGLFVAAAGNDYYYYKH